jgi:NADH-quinone oxidoreductase subunit C
MIVEPIVESIQVAVPGATLEIMPNPSPSAQHSIVVDAAHAVAVAAHLRDATGLQFDYCTNVTGVDWLPKETSTTTKVKKMVDGVEQEVAEVTKTTTPGFLEVVYHLYSIVLRHGPLVLRMRTLDREHTHLPSLTPVWRSAEFQEREIFDLYGVRFDGHPDLRRLLMWDEFTDHPMRRDYVDPDDYEYEPTAHGEVLERAREHQEGATP